MFENHTTRSTVRRDQHLRISSHDLLITCHLGRRWAGTGRYYWRYMYEQQLLLNASDATFYIYLSYVASLSIFFLHHEPVSRRR